VGSTPLHTAAWHGNMDVAELLIFSSADVNIKNDYHMTPLHGAASKGHIETAKFLMAKGANIEAKDASGATPLQYALTKYHWHIGKLLVDKGAQLDIFTASALGRIERVKSFLWANPPLLNSKDLNEQTPLYWAAHGGNKAIAELLIAKGAGVNSKNHEGSIPLHVAALRGYKDVVKLLLANSADVNAKDKYGYTPLDLAKKADQKAVVELFSKYMSGENITEQPVRDATDRMKWLRENRKEHLLYVDANAKGLNNGRNWNDAYNDLQDALSEAEAGDQIWVAQGIYYPSSDYGLGIGERGKHFKMVNGVGIYGGFPSGGGRWENRNPNLYETILSGDLLGNDNPSTPVKALLNDSRRAENCFHVFYHPKGLALGPSAILDGFTITSGNANGSLPHDHGGGDI